jgi:hypothetical protein
MSYSSDLTHEQWALLEPAFNAPSTRGRKHADDLRSGCQWHYLARQLGAHMGPG